MKNAVIVIVIIVLAGIGLFFYFGRQGHDVESLESSLQIPHLKITCSNPTNIGVGATTTITVNNNSEQKSYENISFRVVAFNEEERKISEQQGEFLRNIEPNGSLTKVMTLPEETRECKCVIVEADER